MLEVIDVIINQTQFEYIKDEAKYLNYLTMVNMPFLSNKIEWGTSIRGAWFDEYGHPADKVNHYKFDFDLKIDKKKGMILAKDAGQDLAEELKTLGHKKFLTKFEKPLVSFFKTPAITAF